MPGYCHKKAAVLRIVVYGPPCSGKTTISMALSLRLPGHSRLSFHRMCLQEAKAASAEGREWAARDRAGLPLEALLANNIAEKHLRGKSDFILEGYPKQTDEVAHFGKLCGRIQLLLILKEESSVLEQRRATRLECDECAISWTDGTSRCPMCRQPGVRKGGDSPGAFWKRLREYEVYSIPALASLKELAETVFEGGADYTITHLDDLLTGLRDQAGGGQSRR